MSPGYTEYTRHFIRWYIYSHSFEEATLINSRTNKIHDRGYAVTQAELDMSMDDFLGLAHNGQIE